MRSKPNGPIFIVGAPRSGTTLLRNMLNRHPDISMCRETGFFHYVYSRRHVFGDLSQPQNRERLVREYLSIQRIKRMRIDLPALETKLLREAASYEAFFSAMLTFVAD
ncbi:MAG: sulfotransferase, partial [Bryobacteraceae bacterium]